MDNLLSSATRERNCGKCGEKFEPKQIPQIEFTSLFCPKCELAQAKRIYIHEPWRLTPGMSNPLSPRRHARYSPSSYGAREKCLGWTPDTDPSKATIAADRGTAIHAAIETEEPHLLTDADDRACADMCLKYVDKLADEAGPHQRHKEIQLRILDQFGIADDVIVAREEANLTDYKTGWLPVPDAEVNAQAQAYTLGVFDHFPGIKRTKVHLLMPRQRIISTAVYTREEHYHQIKDRIFRIIEGAKAVDKLFAEGRVDELLSKLNPSPQNCEYCGRKGDCPALHSWALQAIKVYDPVIHEELGQHGSQITDPNVMAKALILAPLMEEWAKGIKKSALAMRMDDGVELPGFKLMERSGARKITSPQTAWDIVHEILTPEEFTASCDVSLPELEKAVAAKAPRGAKAQVKQKLEDQLRDRGALQINPTVHYLKREIE